VNLNIIFWRIVFAIGVGLITLAELNTDEEWEELE